MVKVLICKNILIFQYCLVPVEKSFNVKRKSNDLVVNVQILQQHCIGLNAQKEVVQTAKNQPKLSARNPVILSDTDFALLMDTFRRILQYKKTTTFSIEN
ncbi:hypothetical protein B9Z55_015603 [Caenorhabditis nigoni]|uniref:Uncharacterized protein n=1 Tax=Caenorhabditis nigoni TaxID=1611254 RepID=A0A2G5UB97_9PELO|nr:hypothetical protein B9Z55_015603 [Caenorhabditis nigoni]